MILPFKYLAEMELSSIYDVWCCSRTVFYTLQLRFQRLAVDIYSANLKVARAPACVMTSRPSLSTGRGFSSRRVPKKIDIN